MCDEMYEGWERGCERMGAGCGKWGRECERIGCKGEVDVLGGVKDGDEAIYI